MLFANDISETPFESLRLSYNASAHRFAFSCTPPPPPPHSCIQEHPKAIVVCDKDATMELKVKTVKYFEGLLETEEKLMAGDEDRKQI